MARVLPLLLAAVAVLVLAAPSATAATCSSYPNQAAAQRAADTRDADGDGIYCESLPCPCARGGGPTPRRGTKARPRHSARTACVRTDAVQKIGFSGTRMPAIRAHFRAAVAAGWPRVLTLNRAGAELRRMRLLRDLPTREGFDRDEYPPAIGRRSYKADVAYVPVSQNRRHGAQLGAKLRRFCDGTKFRYVFY